MARASDESRLWLEQLRVCVQVTPGSLRIRRQCSINDRLFERQLHTLDPGPGWPAGAGHKLITGQRRPNRGDRLRVEPADPLLEVVDLLDVGVVAGSHVGPGEGQQSVELVTRVANQPANGPILPTGRVVLDWSHMQTDQLG